MDTIFSLRDDVEEERLDLDSLYKSKQARDHNALQLYKKILARVHTRIKCVSRRDADLQHCWYLVPEMVVGAPKFDNGQCIAYLIHQLKTNQFLVRYTHPNLLYISWGHWTPSHVRAEFRKRTGIAIDGLGNKKSVATGVARAAPPPLALKKKADFRDTSTYRPTGKLVYSDALMKKVEATVGKRM